MMNSDLSGKVALVTGASRGIGKGIVLGLAEAKATVYFTGRTVSADDQPENLPGTLRETANEAEHLGGNAIAVRCDHRDDDQVRKVFETLDAEQGRLDLLVNNVWGGYELMSENGVFTWNLPFWEQPLWRWDAMFGAGLRAHYIASVLAAQRMVRAGRGLIVNISFRASQKLIGNVPYSISKAATDRFTAYAAQELREYGVAVVSLYPGLVKTERVMAAKDFIDLHNAEPPRFVGRAVAALAADERIMERTGSICTTAALSREYLFTDVDGSRPQPLSLDDM
jgi:dehydrogenase/reductase SDR family protein 1